MLFVPVLDSLTLGLANLSIGGILLSLWLSQRDFTSLAIIRSARVLLVIWVVLQATLAASLFLLGAEPEYWASSLAFLALVGTFVVLPRIPFSKIYLFCSNSISLPAAKKWGRVVLILFCPILAVALADLFVSQEAGLPMGDQELQNLMSDPQVERTLVDLDVSPVCSDWGKPIEVRVRKEARLAILLNLLNSQKRIFDGMRLHDRLIQVPNGWKDECNCHGWVFTGGRYWVSGDQIPRILRENGYFPMKKPKVNDLVVYRDSSGEVTHTGIVRSLVNNQVILVESKWGQLGRYLHPHDEHCYRGNTYTFYRSFRPGHLLRGLPTELPESVPDPRILQSFDSLAPSILFVSKKDAPITKKRI